MRLTPDEARQQRCPFYRFVVNESDVAAAGRPPIVVHEVCSGPDCKIGWRWVDKPVTAHEILSPNDTPFTGTAYADELRKRAKARGLVPDPEHRSTICGAPFYWTARTHGYCGAFGNP